MSLKIACAACGKPVCEKNEAHLASNACPMNTVPDVIERGLNASLEPGMKEFARQAAIIQSESFVHTEEGAFARYSRLEETMLFAEKMGYKKLGLAFCGALRNESGLINRILLDRGFDVVSVCCKVGALSKELLDVKNSDGSYGLMCNPVTQAELLNEAGTEFNIAVGLCVGHDSLFLKHADALSTVLIVKDKVCGHNPVAALQLSGKYYKKFMRR